MICLKLPRLTTSPTKVKPATYKLTPRLSLSSLATSGVQRRFLALHRAPAVAHPARVLIRHPGIGAEDRPRRPVMAMSTSESTLTVEEQAALVEDSKRQAAFQAVKDYLESSYRHIGIGSGSTAAHVVEAVAGLGHEVTSKMLFYPTGEQSRGLILDAKLPIAYIRDLPPNTMLDVNFDGADEVDEDLNLIKGGGACQYQEKLVAVSARRFVCVADFRKQSPRLGINWKKGIPIEVRPDAVNHVMEELRAMGSHEMRVRQGLPGKAGPIVTDGGGLIVDAAFSPLLLPKDAANGVKGGDGEDGIWTVEALAQRLKSIVGVVEHGLFHGKNGDEAGLKSEKQKPVAAYFGMKDGSVEVLRAHDKTG